MAINPVPEKRRCYTADEMIARLKSEMNGRLQTQKAFAKAVGISQPMLSQILNRERLPSDEVLKRIRMKAVEHYEDAK